MYVRPLQLVIMYSYVLVLHDELATTYSIYIHTCIDAHLQRLLKKGPKSADAATYIYYKDENFAHGLCIATSSYIRI